MPDGSHRSAADLLFANAVLQWVPDHPAVLRRLLESLPAGGVLAVQMPDNTNEPALRLMEEVAGSQPFASTLATSNAARNDLPSPDVYYDLLRPLATRLDIWHTVYNHVMAGPAGNRRMVQGLGPAAVSLSPRRGRARRLRRRVHGTHRPRLPGTRRRTGAVAVSAPVHRGGAVGAPLLTFGTFRP